MCLCLPTRVISRLGKVTGVGNRMLFNTIVNRDNVLDISMKQPDPMRRPANLSGIKQRDLYNLEIPIGNFKDTSPFISFQVRPKQVGAAR